MDDLIEFGHNKQTGFIWLKHKKPKEKKFKKIGKLVCFGTEVTGFIENRRMHKLTCVKYKEFMISIAITDISIKDPQCKEMTFTIANGFSVRFPGVCFRGLKAWKWFCYFYFNNLTTVSFLFCFCLRNKYSHRAWIILKYYF